MQTLTEIRQMLEAAGLSPQKAFGQCFLVDHNLLGKLLELAELPAGAGAMSENPRTLIRSFGWNMSVRNPAGLPTLSKRECIEVPTNRRLCAC